MHSPPLGRVSNFRPSLSIMLISVCLFFVSIPSSDVVCCVYYLVVGDEKAGENDSKSGVHSLQPYSCCIISHEFSLCNAGTEH